MTKPWARGRSILRSPAQHSANRNQGFKIDAWRSSQPLQSRDRRSYFRSWRRAPGAGSCTGLSAPTSPAPKESLPVPSRSPITAASHWVLLSISSSSQIAIRMLSGEPVKDWPALLRRRIADAVACRERLVHNTDAYRLVFSEADFLLVSSSIVTMTSFPTNRD